MDNNTESIFKGMAQIKASRYFKDDDYIGDDGFRHCAHCKGAKEMTISFKGTDLPDATVPRACPCMERIDEIRRSVQEEQERLERVERIRNVGLRTEQLRATRFEIDDSKDSDTSKAMRAYASAWQEMKENNIGLLLQGQVGAGKSFYATCIANAVIEQTSIKREPVILPVSKVEEYHTYYQDERAYFISAPEIVSIASDYSDYGYDRKLELEKKVLHWELLIIDDLGAQRGTEFGSEAVFNVINARCEAGKPVIVTTNLTNEEMESAKTLYEKRIIDRVYGMCPLQFEVVGKSRRKSDKPDRAVTAFDILGKALLRGDA